MDNDTQELIGYGCDPTKSIFDYYVIGPNGKITTLSNPHESQHTHDFAITKIIPGFDSNLFLNWKNLFTTVGGGDGMWQFDDSTKDVLEFFHDMQHQKMKLYGLK